MDGVVAVAALVWSIFVYKKVGAGREERESKKGGVVMKLGLVATIVSAVGIIYGAAVLMTKTPYWWASVILGIALFAGLYVGIRLQEKAKDEKSTKDE